MKLTSPILTLTTDFGTKDGFVGTLKGVIWGICPTARIADISHEISPQNVIEGSFALWRAYSFFPPKTVHIAVIDPGVGTNRRALVARIGKYTFIGPDNGLFTPIIEEAEKKKQPMELVHLTNEKYFLTDVSRTFHGRDIFAPVAAYIANGVGLAELGPFITDPVRLQMPKPVKTETGWSAHITVIDVFGNLTTDLPSGKLTGTKLFHFNIHGNVVNGLMASYGHAQPGALIALADSENFIEIAIVNGSAQRTLNARVGDIVEVVVDIEK